MLLFVVADSPLERIEARARDGGSMRRDALSRPKASCLFYDTFQATNSAALGAFPITFA
jgi:hypothetical protein